MIALPRPLYLALGLFLLGAVIAGMQALHLDQEQEARKASRFSALVEQVINQLNQRMLTYEHGLRGARGAIITAGVEGITRARFREYNDSREPYREFPGARGYGFIRRVAPEQEVAFLEAARRDDKPDFSIRQLTPHNGERLVIQYIEPEANNWQAVGLDIASEPYRLLAARESMASNQPILTHPITLVQANYKPQGGFLLMLPIYQPGQDLSTPTARQLATRALAYTPLVIDEVLSHFEVRRGEFSLSLYDQDITDITGQPQLFYASPEASQPAADGLVQQIPLRLYGRQWLAEIKALPGFVSELNFRSPQQAAANILGLALLLAVLVYILGLNWQRRQQSLLDKARLAAIVESANDAIIGKTLDDRITSWNRAAEQTFGYRAAEVLGQRLGPLIVPDARRHEETEILWRLQRAEPVSPLITQRQRRDGSLIDVAVTLSLIHASDGHVVGASCTLHDITEQKQVQQQLERLNQILSERTAQAESASRTKSEFLANMSHEIRTPMNAILGLSHLLQKQPLPPTAQDMVRRIQIAGRSLMAIINDILDLSKIEAQRLELEQIDFALDEVLDNLASIMSAALHDKAIELLIHPAPLEARYLRGDPLRLGQVLINLTANAIKFTERGEVELKLSTRPGDHPDQGYLHISVRDTGIGIPAHKQQDIFKAFTQADTSTTRTFGGTGLGLTISRRLVELMGGQLQLQSTPGSGSEFSFEIPVQYPPAPEPIEPAAQSPLLLIAEDHPIARQTLSHIAHTLGWQSRAFDSGPALLAYLQQPDQPQPDALLLDWNMPGQTGLETAHACRQHPASAGLPTILMATTYERDQLQSQPQLTECTEVVLTKPITLTALRSALQEASQRRRASTLLNPHQPTVKAHPLSGLRLLVVDDSDINRDVAEAILTEAGALVEQASDGQKAVQLLEARPTAFHLVLMDVQMPVMDGYQATRRLRDIPALATLPVIALTAGALDIQREQAKACGMNAFIAKPFEADALIRQIQQLAYPQSPRPKIEITDAALPLNLLEAPEPLIDAARGLAIFQTPAQYQHYLRKFAREYAQDPRTPNLQDPAACTSWVHRLKGVAGSLGLTALAHQAAQSEQQLQAGYPPAEACSALLETLSNTLQHIACYAPAPKTTIVLGSSLINQLEKALQSLHSGRLEGLESLLDALGECLSPEQLQPLHEALEHFDFEQACCQLRELATCPEVAGFDSGKRADNTGIGCE